MKINEWVSDNNRYIYGSLYFHYKINVGVITELLHILSINMMSIEQPVIHRQYLYVTFKI